MLFSSVYFIYYFLPALLICYYVAPKPLKNIILLIFSLVFYSWGEPVYVFLIIFSGVFNYVMAGEIQSLQQNSRPLGMSPKKTLIFTVVVNLFILCFFKYYGFALDIFNSVTGAHVKYTTLPLPIGISFYTFQALSYVFDVYKHKVNIRGKLLEFMLYLSLFPQLIAGPIVQYKDVEDQLYNRTVSWDDFGYGVERFIIGLSKKVLLANTLGSFHQMVIALPPSKESVLASWIGILAFTFQIYFDFSGYSDMAIGLGRMFGFQFKENFNHPYISKSVTEFWRRWHISLGSWFREYLYIPMGGNRVNPMRHIFNLVVVWGLTGLWHGASYNFVIWGLFYCLLLIIEKYSPVKLPSVLKGPLTMLAVIIGWVFFSSETAGGAIEYLGKMFFIKGIPFSNSEGAYILHSSIIILVIAWACSTEKVSKAYKVLESKNKVVPMALLVLLLVLSTASLIYSSYNPFLYFRF